MWHVEEGWLIMTEPVQIPLKRKWRVGQTNGRYKGGHNHNNPATPKKNMPTQVSTAVMIMGPNGKTKIVKEG